MKFTFFYWQNRRTYQKEHNRNHSNVLFPYIMWNEGDKFRMREDERNGNWFAVE